MFIPLIFHIHLNRITQRMAFEGEKQRVTKASTASGRLESQADTQALSTSLFRFKPIEKHFCYLSVASFKTIADLTVNNSQGPGFYCIETHSILSTASCPSSFSASLATGVLEAIWKLWLCRNGQSLWQFLVTSTWFLAWLYCSFASYLHKSHNFKSIIPLPNIAINIL